MNDFGTVQKKAATNVVTACAERPVIIGVFVFTPT